MSVIYDISYKQSEKRVKELNRFLLELDSICDKLYSNLEYAGVWEVLMHLEDVRLKYYIEFYEHNEIVKRKGKTKNVE